MTNLLQMDGTLEVDGETIKWDRHSGPLAIHLPEGDRIILGGDEPDVHAFRVAIRFFRHGYRVGYAMGQTHLRLEIRKLIGAE